MTLTIHNLSAGYGSLEVLRDISFSVPQGSICAILGPNGAGKTTIMRAVSGLIPSRKGSIEMNGARIDKLSAEQRVRKGLMLTPEGREMFPSLTVKENLLMGAFTQPQAHFQADLAKILEYFPRLKQRLNEPAASLSGGEAQMAAIGRSLMARPSVLLLDEPSHGLAPAIVERMFAIISKLNKEEGLTVLIVEQNARQALALAQQAYVLQAGKISLSGASEDLAQDQTVQELYLGG